MSETTDFEEEVFRYLDELRESGITNMFVARLYVVREFLIESERAGQLVSRWMKTTFAERHPEMRHAPANPPTPLSESPEAPMDKTRLGLYGKFRVERTDGQSAEGGKHDGCEYFVLDLNHDPFAYAAIVTYARKCSDKYPALADDLLSVAARMIPWMAEQQMNEWTPEHREQWARFVHNDPERR